MSTRLRRPRRRWSAEEKQRIVAQTKVPGSSVSEVARRYDVNANMIFKWARDPRFNRSVEPESEETTFLPVELHASSASDPETVKDYNTPGRIEIRLATGHRLEMSGAFDVDVVIRLVRGLCL